MLLIKNGRTAIAVPLANIAVARGYQGGWTITDVNGNDHQVDDFSWNLALETTIVSSIPAQPGTFLIGMVADEGDPDPFWRSAVVGWGVYADGATRPIAIDVDMVTGGDWAVQFPDGRVETPERQFETVKDWRASVGAPDS
ncbi:MAG: hypothetical protein KAY22_25450 [Rhizorhabdus sp.]|uniref:hypothetical protein n=1 Tax=Rhizorhabdus sp. TaxID=1968843 RepID=UPI001B60425A|nr:hypothetical protein [Rhizorhabdus sp.]MBP8235644.1 hypothetical protein [Rhizorhabdus sp.]